MMQLHLDGNEAWGDATMCALVEALESGQGKSLKEVNMDDTGLGSIGYQRVLKMVRAGLHRRLDVSFLGCSIPGAKHSGLSTDSMVRNLSDDSNSEEAS